MDQALTQVVKEVKDHTQEVLELVDQALTQVVKEDKDHTLVDQELVVLDLIQEETQELEDQV